MNGRDSVSPSLWSLGAGSAALVCVAAGVFARKRYWLTSVAVLVLIVGAVASVLAWRSHVERVERELDAQALAGATSVVNAYCDAVMLGRLDEAAAMDGLADSTDPEWTLTDAALI